MKRFVTGQAREQATLFPERLDDFIGEDNPIRVVDLFVDALDLRELGFERVDPAATGRPSYHPAVLLKLYIYGYLNRVQSSRRLERECQRNVELMWLTERLEPDHKTIANFRKDNGKAIRKVCQEFVELCRRLELFKQTIVAIDGSKFKAVNNRDKNFTPAKMKRRLEQLDKHIDRYLRELDSADQEEPAIAEARSERLQKKIGEIKEEIERIKALEPQMLASEDQQISLTDPDARAMKGRGAAVVAYNVQTAVEPKHHLIVAHEVTNSGSDQHQLVPMAQRARETMQIKDITALADRGYYNGEDLKTCAEEGITAYVPKTYPSNNVTKGLFHRDKFHYKPDQNEYRCPAGETLIWRFRGIERGKTLDSYWSSACPGCEIRDRCTGGKYRRIKRWEHEAVVEAAQERLKNNPKAMRLRSQTVEHPFGTIKAWMGHTHFLTKTLPRVKTEMSLHVLAYNLKRVMNILGAEALIEALSA